MKALVHSHVHHSEKLHFNVMFSSSLPPFPDSFQGAWSNLSDLELQCQEDNGGSSDIWGSITSTGQQLECPALERLVIDGRSYYNACKEDIDMHWTVRCSSISDLTIYRFTPLPGESFSLTNFTLPIVILPSLESLCMSDLTLHPSTLAATSPLNLEGNIQCNHTHHLELIADLLSLLPNYLDIILTRCAMGHPSRSFNWVGCLTLRDQAGEDLIPFLRCWHGKSLVVENCLGFNDAVLDMMATFENGGFFCAPCMVDLDIVDCFNFSAAALKRLVSARYQVPDEDTDLVIHSVYVCGLAPDISAEEQRQISQYVGSFAYHPYA
jgi:hypothetical protein